MSKKRGVYNFEVSLPVTFLREGKQFVAYSPALDLSTSAATLEAAEKRFDEVVHIFFEELLRKGTLEEVLEDLGWQKVDQEWEPPQVVEHRTERVRISTAA